MEEKVLGGRLKELRANKRISLGKLAEAVRISASNLADYENDAKNPTVDRLRRIAEFYGVSLDYLAGTTEIKSVDLSTRAICDATGLSEYAVNMLTITKKAIDDPNVEGVTIGLAPGNDPAIATQSAGQYLRTACDMLSVLICHKDFYTCLRHLSACVYPDNEDSLNVLNSFALAFKALAAGTGQEGFKVEFQQLVFNQFTSFFKDVIREQGVSHGNDQRA